MQEYAALQTSLGYVFNDGALLTRAITHSSYIFEHKLRSTDSNERLEFLGDAVLELCISDWLFARFPKLPEGKLTRRRAALVREETLTSIARTLKLGTHMRMGHGEAQTGGREKPSLLSDTLEAILGAVYLDGGFEAVCEVIHRLFEPFIEEPPAERDHKTILQELLQKNSRETAVYQIISESGPPHKRSFVAQVLHLNKVLAQGKGSSKKEAEQAAAKAALEG